MLDDKTMLSIAGVYSFYDKELSEFACEVWADALADFDPPLIREALRRHMKDPDAGKWLPKPADIIKQMRGDESDEARLAWAKVLEHIRGGNRGGLSGPAMDAVAAMGGSSVIAMADESQNGFLERRFVDFFKAYKRRMTSPPLLGADSVLRIE